jgi:urea transport system substrate-binding protein
MAKPLFCSEREMRRRYWLAGGVVVILGCSTVLAFDWFKEAQKPIVVGILHSQTGPMAISEKSMIDAEVLAIEEINAAGGLLGRPIQAVVRDGQSDWPTYAKEARRLIEEFDVCVVFGCWTSASRKTVRPVFEEKDHLLIYPMAYEGLEESKNIIYTGAAPNQQIIPVVKWSFDKLGYRKFFLVGSDYVWPHSVNEIVKDQLKALKAELVGEEYIFFGSSKVAGVVERIKKAKPDVILSAVVGDSNVAFYRELHEAGIRPEQTPVISFSIAEDELRKLNPMYTEGHYSAWNYFQSIDRPENRAFVTAFQNRYGTDRVTNDVVSASYNSVRFWAHAVAEAQTTDVKAVRDAIKRQSLNAPEGVISIDPQTNHTWRPVYIGRARRDGQFEIVWTSQKTIRPIPYPITRTQEEWDNMLNSMYRGWKNSWANPVDQTAQPTKQGG